MSKTLIKGGEVVREDVQLMDVLVENGKIIDIKPSIDVTSDVEVVDAKGCYVFPGFIDPHTHFQMTNAITTTADSYETGSKAAVMGGTTTVVNFASPVVGEKNSLHEALKREHEKADGNSYCNYRFHIEILDFNSEIENEIYDMANQGVNSFKVYMAYAFMLDDDRIYKTVAAVKKAGGFVEAHCENGIVVKDITEKIKNSGLKGPVAHPKTRPSEIEAEAVNRLAYIGRMLDTHVHVVHLSTRLGLEEIRKHRKLGTDITAETCPQYLFLDESYYNKEGFEGAKWVMSPPLRTEVDKKELLKAVRNKEILTLATDHCAYSYEKQKIFGKDDFTKIPGGAPGVQERIPLAYTYLLDRGVLNPQDFVKFCSTNAAKLYNMYPQKGTLSLGSDADIVVYRKSGDSTFEDNTVLTKAGYTCYPGFHVRGQVKDVLVNGEFVVKNCEFVDNKVGRYVGLSN